MASPIAGRNASRNPSRRPACGSCRVSDACRIGGHRTGLLRKSPAERYPVAETVLEASSAVPRHGSSATRRAGPKPVTSIAVLPFNFLSGIEERKGLSLGFADALITMLSNLDDVTVPPTSAILNYTPGTEPARACRDLGSAIACRVTSSRSDRAGGSRCIYSTR